MWLLLLLAAVGGRSCVRWLRRRRLLLLLVERLGRGEKGQGAVGAGRRPPIFVGLLLLLLLGALGLLLLWVSRRG